MDTGTGLCRQAGQDGILVGRGRRGARGVFRRLAAACLAGAFVTAGTAASAAGARAADDIAGPAEVAALVQAWQRWALHALVVPLLESEGPLSWTTPHALQPCLESSTVRLDGEALPAQRPLPLRRPQVLSMRLDDCWPLGPHWLGLRGTVDIVLRHDGDRLHATVRPIDLHAVGGGARIALRDAFAGALSLAGARSGR